MPTGPHPIPPLHAPESDPPLHARGASWKAIGAALAVLCGLAGSTGAIVYQLGEESAAQRAVDRHQTEQITELTREVRRFHVEQRTSATRLAVLRRDVEAISRGLEKMERRRASRER